MRPGGRPVRPRLPGPLSDTRRQTPGPRVAREPELRHGRYWPCVSWLACPFLVVSEVLNRPVYIGRLFAFVAAAKEQHACPAQHRVVHLISRPPVDAQFRHALAQTFAVAEVSKRKPVDPRNDPRPRLGIVQTCQPFADHIFSRAGHVPANFDHQSSVTYKSRFTLYLVRRQRRVLALTPPV